MLESIRIRNGEYSNDGTIYQWFWCYIETVRLFLEYKPLWITWQFAVNTLTDRARARSLARLHDSCSNFHFSAYAYSLNAIPLKKDTRSSKQA